MRLALLFIVGSVVAAENDPAGNDHSDPAEPAQEPVKKEPTQVEDKPSEEVDDKPPQPPKKQKAPAAERIQAVEEKLEELSSESQLPKIAESEFCATQVSKLCSRKVQKDDYLVYNCLEQAASKGEFVDEDCQHFLWIWKHAQTENPDIQDTAMQNCRKKKITEIAPACVKYYDEELGKQNKLIPCLMDYRLQLEEKMDGHCRNFLTDVSRVIFGDYRLICNFVNMCKRDIEKYHCGRESFNSEAAWLVDHSQGEVVHCLEEKLTDDETAVSDQCVKELVNLAELSADDFQLDRAFYLACVDDRDHFKDCSEIPAGDGAVYRCLFSHKFDKDMTRDCQEAIEVREKLIYESDYKGGYHLNKKCRKTLRVFGCDKAMEDNLQMSQEFKGLSDILMCVEKKLRNEFKDPKTGKVMVLDRECDAELMSYRQFLMEDYELSPEVVTQCATEIRDFCDGGLQKQGETLHCLMGLETNEDNDDDQLISDECTEALYELIEETEAEENFHVDKRLEAACAPVVNSLCPDTADDDAEILSCLLENVHHEQMIRQRPQCRKALLETQYFLSRDFSWDKRFRRVCHEEAEDLCEAGIEDADDEDELEIPLSLIIGCLYRHTHPFEEDVGDNAAGIMLSDKCSVEVHRIMKERAMEVELNPELEEKCRPSLGSYCSEVEASKNIEFTCLQEKYEEMRDSDSLHDIECAEMVGELTGIASQELDLEQVLFAACEPMVERFCASVVKQEDEGQVLGCLISHKNEEEMDDKCRAGVFHFQIISLSDYKLSYSFFKSCKRDIHDYCKTDEGSKQSKPAIVHCLSQAIRDDVLTEQQHRISEDCRKQVNFELLAEFEHIKLNPELAKNCKEDIKNFCTNVKQGSGRVEECLKKQKHNLDKKCVNHLFKDMKIQAENPVVDFYLIKSCKEVIKSHCSTSTDSMAHVVDCLAALKDDKDMTNNCKKAVRARQIAASQNIQLNPVLMAACKMDVGRLCQAEFGKIKNAPETMSDQEKIELFEGSVITCLKNNFVRMEGGKEEAPQSQLSTSCAHHVEQLMADEGKDFELDPELVKFCGRKKDSPLETICKPDVPGHTDPIECLKEKFMEEELKGDANQNCRTYIAKLLKESQVDISVDSTLQNACGLDIKNYCADIDPGHGRRITCLVNRMKRQPNTLTDECLTKLKERSTMWNKAQSMKIEGMQDLVNVVSRSNNAQYIFGVLAGICLFVMFCGMWLGRVTSAAKERKAL